VNQRMIHPFKLAHSSAKEELFVTGMLHFLHNFASHSLPDSRIPRRPACRPQRGPARNNRALEPKSPARINVATNGGSPESRPFPPFLRRVCSRRTPTPSPSHWPRRRFRPKDQAPECGCLPISLIARDAASAGRGAKCWSGLGESSRSRRRDKPLTSAGERPESAQQAFSSSTLF
jgi:hypothetical protein